jgi:hypothetical protein
MSKKLAFKILVVVWAVALIVVGVIKYENSRGCSSCKADNSFINSLTESQKEMLLNRQAVLLYPDSGDPIYVDKYTANSRSNITAFSIEQPSPLTEKEVKWFSMNVLYTRYRDSLPEELQTLRVKRKLAILRNENNEFFIVALADALQHH